MNNEETTNKPWTYRGVYAFAAIVSGAMPLAGQQ